MHPPDAEPLTFLDTYTIASITEPTGLESIDRYTILGPSVEP